MAEQGPGKGGESHVKRGVKKVYGNAAGKKPKRNINNCRTAPRTDQWKIGAVDAHADADGLQLLFSSFLALLRYNMKSE